MAKPRTVFMCLQCGQGSPQWGGRCNACGEWNTLVEEVEAAAATVAQHPSTLTRPQSISAVDSARFVAVPTGLPEIDRVLGGVLSAASRLAVSAACPARTHSASSPSRRSALQPALSGIAPWTPWTRRSAQRVDGIAAPAISSASPPAS